MYGIGIDVSQATLDVAVHEQAFDQFSNDKRGFVRLIQWLKQWPITQVVLEASGGYERAALQPCWRRWLIFYRSPATCHRRRGSDVWPNLPSAAVIWCRCASARCSACGS